MTHLNSTHPRDKNLKPYSYLYALCSFNLGTTGCCRVNLNTEVDKFGLGTSLYFKFAKLSLALVTILSVINALPAYIYFQSKFNTLVNVLGFQQSGQEISFSHGWKSYGFALRQVMTSLSLGGISGLSNNFYELRLPEGSWEHQFSLRCKSGFISTDPNLSYYGLVESQDSVRNLFYQIDTGCNVNDQFQSSFSNCQGQKTCDVTLSSSIFEPACLQKKSDKKFYLKINCYGATFSYFGKNRTI